MNMKVSKIKFTFYLLLALVVALALTSCGGGKKKGYTEGVLSAEFNLLPEEFGVRSVIISSNIAHYYGGAEYGTESMELYFNGKGKAANGAVVYPSSDPLATISALTFLCRPTFKLQVDGSPVDKIFSAYAHNDVDDDVLDVMADIDEVITLGNDGDVTITFDADNRCVLELTVASSTNKKQATFYLICDKPVIW